MPHTLKDIPRFWAGDLKVGAGDLDAGAGIALYTGAGAVPVSATTALLMVGNGGFVGGGAPQFNGSGSGTLIGGNVPAGYLGDLINLEIGGVSKLKVDKDGAIYQNGVLLTTGGSMLATNNVWTGSNTFRITDNVNAPEAPLSLSHKRTSGSPSPPFGISLDFLGDDNSNTSRTYGQVWAQASNTATAAVVSDFIFNCANGGSLQENLRIKGAGDITAAGTFQAVQGLLSGNTGTVGAMVDIRRPGSGVTTVNNITSLRVTGPADFTVPTGQDPVDVQFLLNRTVNLNTGARSSLRAFEVIPPTYTAVAASTITNAMTVFINGPPVAGSNVTFTHSYALYVNGMIRVDPAIQPNAFEFNQNDVTLTGGITGRIPILINGVQRYIPYYTS